MVKATAKETAFLDSIGERYEDVVAWRIGIGATQIDVEKEQSRVWHARSQAFARGRLEGTGASPLYALVDLRARLAAQARMCEDAARAVALAIGSAK